MQELNAADRVAFVHLPIPAEQRAALLRDADPQVIAAELAKHWGTIQDEPADRARWVRRLGELVDALICLGCSTCPPRNLPEHVVRACKPFEELWTIETMSDRACELLFDLLREVDWNTRPAGRSS